MDIGVIRHGLANIKNAVTEDGYITTILEAVKIIEDQLAIDHSHRDSMAPLHTPEQKFYKNLVRILDARTKLLELARAFELLEQKQFGSVLRQQGSVLINAVDELHVLYNTVGE